nr:hypothetical protein [Tanacetum cinerariifolium]
VVLAKVMEAETMENFVLLWNVKALRMLTYTMWEDYGSGLPSKTNLHVRNSRIRIREVGIWPIDIQKQKEESDSNLSMDESDEVDIQNDVRPGEENTTKMINMKPNEGDASTNDSELGSCPPGFEFLKYDKKNGIHIVDEGNSQLNNCCSKRFHSRCTTSFGSKRRIKSASSSSDARKGVKIVTDELLSINARGIESRAKRT